MQSIGKYFDQLKYATRTMEKSKLNLSFDCSCSTNQAIRMQSRLVQTYQMAATTYITQSTK